MGRAQRHSDDDFVDAAAALFASGGDRALTMTSVSRQIGASNGAIYHRYPDRTALRAALWLRTARRFQTDYFDFLGDRPTVADVVAAGVWVTEWCRNHLAQAIVLQAGARAFHPDEWSDSARAELEALDAATRARVAGVVEGIAARTGRQRDEIAFTLFDLPLAAVRRHLLAGEPPPRRVDDLVRALTKAVLAPG